MAISEQPRGKVLTTETVHAVHGPLLRALPEDLATRVTQIANASGQDPERVAQEVLDAATANLHG